MRGLDLDSGFTTVDNGQWTGFVLVVHLYHGLVQITCDARYEIFIGDTYEPHDLLVRCLVLF